MDSKKLATEVLEAVGGKENVSSALHCMTRLRVVLKDEDKSSDEKLKAINGVIQVVHAGGQVQIVIGPGVDTVYDSFCEQTGLNKQSAVDENLDKPKEKLTVKSAINNVLSTISGSIIPILPLFMVAGIFKMVSTVLGPRNLGWLAAENELFILCELVNSACFYFLPFFAAYTSAKKFKANPIYAMILVAIMVHPTMLDIVSAGTGFHIFGIPMKLVNYTQAVLPIILIVWVLSIVEGWVKKIMPSMLRTLGIPVLTVFIMLPISLCVLGPVCFTVMGWIADLILWLNNTIGILAIIVVAISWNFIIMFGMHMPIMMALLPVWLEMGYDAIVSPAGIAITLASLGVELGYALRAHSAEGKQLGWTCFITNFTANVGEPYLYGIYLQDRKAFLWHTIGSVAGSVVMYMIGAKVTMFSGVGFPVLNFVRFGEFVIQGAIGMAVAFVVSFALCMVFGFQKKDSVAQ